MTDLVVTPVAACREIARGRRPRRAHRRRRRAACARRRRGGRAEGGLARPRGACSTWRRSSRGPRRSRSRARTEDPRFVEVVLRESARDRAAARQPADLRDAARPGLRLGRRRPLERRAARPRACCCPRPRRLGRAPARRAARAASPCWSPTRSAGRSARASPASRSAAPASSRSTTAIGLARRRRAAVRRHTVDARGRRAGGRSPTT